MAAKDFTANQIRMSKLIMSGGIGNKIGLAIYSGSVSSDYAGAVSDSAMFTNVGNDISVFVSGTLSSRGGSNAGSVLLGGDQIVSGSLFVAGTGVSGGSISGSIHHTQGGLSYLVAGSNITIASASNGQVTINSSGGGSTQNLFETIAVAGQSNVVADTATDTLTLVGGSNVTITTNAGSDEITFAATDTNTQLTTEEVQDIVGAMFTGNTETNITATYEDGDGTIDLVATDTNETYDLNATTDGDNVDLNLTSTSGGDNSVVQLTAGSNITLTRNSSSEVTIASTGGAILQTSVYSEEGGFRFAIANNVNHMNERIGNPGVAAAASGHGIGSKLTLANNDEKCEGFIMRTLVPTGANNVELTVCFAANPGGSGTGKVLELLVCGRKWEAENGASAAVAANADTNTNGKNRWMDSGDAALNSTNGGRWRGFISATQASNEIAVAREGDQLYIQKSRSLSLANLINAGSSSITAGDVLDIAVVRNATNTANERAGTPRDNIAGDVEIFWCRVEFTA